MAQIKILPPEVAQKIAAGEVIERPASVVKELVENSIDAAATQITIEIRNGGMELIRVQDNGSGIARDDLRLAFEAHATSKISEVDDLFALYTLGFRGEALPSIASVSKLTLYSRPPEQKTGYKILNVNGEYQVEPVGTPPGTTVEVRDLFYNVPARLKFVKSPTAERRRVVELASMLALAHPHISFRLVVEGKTSLVTPGSGRLLDSILLVEGKNVEPQLLKLSTTTAWGRIQGYLGTPQLAKGNRSGQVFIVNGRVIENRTLRAALEKAYEGLLPKRTFPWAVLVVEIQPELVDCNVHPAKLEVRFADEQAIFNETLQAVRAGLAGRNIAPKLTKPQNASAPPRTAKPAVQAMLRWQPETWEFMDQVLRKHKPRVRGAEGGADQGREAAAGVKETAVGDYTAGSLDDVRAMLRSGRIIGQLHQTYILLETPQGLWILDQHIVHERILVDKFRRAWEQSAIQVQEILPLHLEFTPSEALLVAESLELLAEFGVELEPFGGSSFILRAVPSFLAHSAGSWKEEILEIAQNAGKTTGSKEEALITLACKGAVKAGQYLEEREMRALVDGLAQSENPFTCPHGRPIIVRLETEELLRRFGRL
ncbi:MAG TPA: DNA mismatch repair endonuclease MutL [Limnochordia bacterium]|nr:DNA mismatch repair endonuclease MutL [Limnochordia bacterium]